jgi:hypothetical protein
VPWRLDGAEPRVTALRRQLLNGRHAAAKSEEARLAAVHGAAALVLLNDEAHPAPSARPRVA